MPEKSLPLWKLVISDDPETGIDYVALVDDPAIERNWVAFSKVEFQFKATDTTQRIISGPLIVADMRIYRNDPKHGEHFVMFDSESIKQIVLRFFKNGYTSDVNLMHKDNIHPDNVFMFESFLIDSKRGINTPEGFEALPDGSWFGSYKVDNPVVWDNFIKTGHFKGFSVEGSFVYEKTKTREQIEMDEMIKELETAYAEIEAITK